MDKSTATLELHVSISPSPQVSDSESKPAEVPASKARCKRLRPNKRSRQSITEGVLQVQRSATMTVVQEVEVAERTQKLMATFHLALPPCLIPLWEFCCTLSGDEPLRALEETGLRLVGPFELLGGSVSRWDENHPPSATHDLNHTKWRFQYDVPEVVTVMCCVESQLHFAYLRDGPNDVAVGVVSNDPSRGPQWTYRGNTCLAAVRGHLEDKIGEGCGGRKSARTVSGRSKEDGKRRLLQSLEEFCEARGFDLSDDSKWKSRLANTVCDDVLGLGVVVPFDKVRDVGYRRLMPQKPLVKLLSDVRSGKLAGKTQTTALAGESILDEFDGLMNLVQIANDEGDLGTSLEVGRALFCADTSGEKQVLQRATAAVLGVSYNLLGRGVFSKVLKDHLKQRAKVSEG